MQWNNAQGSAQLAAGQWTNHVTLHLVQDLQKQQKGICVKEDIYIAQQRYSQRRRPCMYMAAAVMHRGPCVAAVQ